MEKHNIQYYVISFAACICRFIFSTFSMSSFCLIYVHYMQWTLLL
jgi:hypothetical protein